MNVGIPFVNEHLSGGDQAKSIFERHFYKIVGVILPREKLISSLLFTLDQLVQVESNVLSMSFPIGMLIA